MSQSNNNNSFFIDKNNFDNNNEIAIKQINPEENTRSFSFSTNETIENDYQLESEIDFNQDFFPKNKNIKFTDFLVDNWKMKIKNYLSKIHQKLN